MTKTRRSELSQKYPSSTRSLSLLDYLDRSGLAIPAEPRYVRPSSPPVPPPAAAPQDQLPIRDSKHEWHSRMPHTGTPTGAATPSRAAMPSDIDRCSPHAPRPASALDRKSLSSRLVSSAITGLAWLAALAGLGRRSTRQARSRMVSVPSAHSSGD